MKEEQEELDPRVVRDEESAETAGSHEESGGARPATRMTLKEYLLSMPDVGEDADFERCRDEHEECHRFEFDD